MNQTHIIIWTKTATSNILSMSACRSKQRPLSLAKSMAIYQVSLHSTNTSHFCLGRYARFKVYDLTPKLHVWLKFRLIILSRTPMVRACPRILLVCVPSFTKRFQCTKSHRSERSRLWGGMFREFFWRLDAGINSWDHIFLYLPSRIIRSDLLGVDRDERSGDQYFFLFLII